MLKFELYVADFKVDEVEWPSGGPLTSEVRPSGARVVNGPNGEAITFGPNVLMLVTEPSGETAEVPAAGTLSIRDAETMVESFNLTGRPEFITLDGGTGIDVLAGGAIVDGERVGLMIAPATETIIRWEPRA